jgi:hypothetical protein
MRRNKVDQCIRDGFMEGQRLGNSGKVGISIANNRTFQGEETIGMKRCEGSEETSQPRAGGTSHRKAKNFRWIWMIK